MTFAVIMFVCFQAFIFSGNASGASMFWLTILNILASISVYIYQTAQEKSAKHYDLQISTAWDRLNSVVKTNEQRLMTSFRSTVSFSSMGVMDSRRFQKDVVQFLTTYADPNLTEEEIANFVSNTVLPQIKRKVEAQTDIDFDDEMSGLDYERLCAGILKDASWKVSDTKRSGDQGVDLIGEKAPYRVAFQCKRYSAKIGNKAVQEVVAGMKLYGCNIGVVVAPNGYTASARTLASNHNVLLAHHDDLDDIENTLKRQFTIGSAK